MPTGGRDCGNCGEGHTANFSPSAEEWAVHDHEGFAGLISSEWPDLSEVAAIAEVLGEGDDDKRRGLLWLVNDCGWKIPDAIERCDEVRTYQSDIIDVVADYAQELASDCVENFDNRASQWPFSCIDWKHAGNELLIGGDIAEVRQGGEYFLVTNASEF
jgi:hypothetical protein